MSLDSILITTITVITAVIIGLNVVVITAVVMSLDVVLIITIIVITDTIVCLDSVPITITIVITVIVMSLEEELESVQKRAARFVTGNYN